MENDIYPYEIIEYQDSPMIKYKIMKNKDRIAGTFYSYAKARIFIHKLKVDNEKRKVSNKK